MTAPKPEIVVIGGCGHVGLPLGLAFARAGRRVAAYDLDPKKVELTNAGRMPFLDRGADELLPRLLREGAFRCTTDRAVVSEAQVVISVIGTPVDEHLNPQFEGMREFILSHRGDFREGQLFVMRSTLYPGTTQRVDELVRREKLGLDVAFCPERVAQGRALEEITALPQIVAGTTERAQRRAEELFRALTPDLIPMSPMGAELTKLFNNAWRYIQFAVANQFFMMANEHGIDFEEIRRAMTHNYPRAQGFPSPGFAAGPCLFKDTMQLSAFHNNGFFIGHAAMLINEGLPNYVVRRVAHRFKLHDLTAGILGMTFKADNDDPRESLSFKLRKILLAECRDVLCSDPFLQEPGLVSADELVRRADLVFIGVPHSAYRGMDFQGKPVIDIWNQAPGRLDVL